VIHRDLKCSNIFVKGNIGQVRFLCDFWDQSDGSPGKFEISNVSLIISLNLHFLHLSLLVS
jgi:L-ascorbate metabolism protein UlaG (beta-lactamase superfamily)